MGFLILKEWAIKWEFKGQTEAWTPPPPPAGPQTLLSGEESGGIQSRSAPTLAFKTAVWRVAHFRATWGPFSRSGAEIPN